MFYKKKSMPLKLCLQLGTHHGLIERLSHNAVYSLLCLYVYLYILCDTMSYIYISFTFVYIEREWYMGRREPTLIPRVYPLNAIFICYFYKIAQILLDTL